MRKIVVVIFVGILVLSIIGDNSCYGAKSKRVAVKFMGLMDAKITFDKKMKDILDINKKAKAKDMFNFPVAVEFEPNYIEKEADNAAFKGLEYSPRKPYLFRIDVNDAKRTIMFGELIVYRVTKFSEHSLVEIEITDDHVEQVKNGQVLVLRFHDPSAASEEALQETDEDIEEEEPEELDAVSAMGKPAETEVCRLILGNRPHEKR